MRRAITPATLSIRVLVLILVFTGMALVARRHDGAAEPWPPE